MGCRQSRNRYLSEKKTEEETIPTWRDTTPFVVPVEEGWVIKVYDGDTITIASKLPISDSPMYRFSVRLNGIDCAEIKGKTPEEKEAAQMAKRALEHHILGKKIKLENVKTEKYGRILAEVIYDGVNYNEWMIDNRYAVKYDGGTKQEVDWSKYVNKTCYL